MQGIASENRTRHSNDPEVTLPNAIRKKVLDYAVYTFGLHREGSDLDNASIRVCTWPGIPPEHVQLYLTGNKLGHNVLGYPIGNGRVYFAEQLTFIELRVLRALSTAAAARL